MRTSVLAAVALLSMLSACPALAGEAGGQAAAGWRTDGLGRYPDARPVTDWGPQTNVIWATPMSNWGNASPVLAGDRIFVTSEPDELLCISRADGAVLWRRSVRLSDTWSDEDRAVAAEKQKESDALKKEYQRLDDEINETWEAKGKDPTNQVLKVRYKTLRETQAKVLGDIGQLSRWAPARTEASNGYTSATPVSDGKHVWVVMGTGVAACFDMAGERTWLKFIEKSKHQEGHATSPILCQDKLLIHIKNLRACQPLTGEMIWECTDVARSWGTPFPTVVGDTPVVVTARGKIVRVSDGQVVCTNAGKLEFASPVVIDGVSYAIEAGGQASKLSPGTNGTVAAEILWTTQPKKDRYYGSPQVLDGLIYAMHQKNWFSAIDARTGEVVKGEKIKLGEGDAYTSVTLAGGLLFVGNESGKMAVIQPGREFKVLAVNTLDKFRSTPVFEGTRMYLRTSKFLYCIGQ